MKYIKFFCEDNYEFYSFYCKCGKVVSNSNVTIQDCRFYCSCKEDICHSRIRVESKVRYYPIIRDYSKENPSLFRMTAN